MDQTLAVRARGLGKSFCDVVALDHVDLDVAEGQIHGLVGPNGAGKTTLLGVLLGLASADAGEVEILGRRVDRRALIPDGVSGFVDGPGLYPSLTPRQNLTALAALRSCGTADVQRVLEQVGLSEVADDRLRGFSLGMRQRAGLAAALLTRPRLLLLDEPANGLDPAGARQVHQVLTGLAATGTAVVLSSHRMDDLAAICSEVTILTTGRVVFSGPLAKLSAEGTEIDYRIRTSDPAGARHLAVCLAGVRPVGSASSPAESGRASRDTVVVRGAEAAIEELVARLVGAGIAVREVAPAVPPLEAAFLALTDPGTDDGADHDDSADRSGRPA